MNEQVLIAYYSINSGYDVVVGTHYIYFNHFHCRSSGENRKKKKTFLCVCIFCRSARALPCDVVAEPQTSTLQVESSDQIHSDDSFVLVFETRFFTVLLYIYIQYIYTLIDTRADTRLYIFYLSLLSFSLSLFFLSLFLFFSSLKFLFIIMHRMWCRVISLG